MGEDTDHAERGLCYFKPSAPHLGPAVSLQCYSPITKCPNLAFFLAQHAATLQKLSFTSLNLSTVSALASLRLPALHTLHLLNVSAESLPRESKDLLVAFVQAHANQLEDVALPIYLFISVVLPRARLISLQLRVTDVPPDVAVQDVLRKLSALQQPTALALNVMSSSFPVVATLLATHSVLTKLRILASNCDNDTRSAFALCTRLTSLTQIDLMRIADLGVASQLKEAAIVPLDRLSNFPSLRMATVSMNPKEYTADTTFLSASRSPCSAYRSTEKSSILQRRGERPPARSETLPSLLVR